MLLSSSRSLDEQRAANQSPTRNEFPLAKLAFEVLKR